MAAQNQGDLFDAYFRSADTDKDGRISGAEAVAFFKGSNLSKQVLAQIWNYADQNRTGFLGRAEFYNALRLVTVAQSKRELTPDIVKAALFTPASARIPAPQINLAAVAAPITAGPTPPASQMALVGSTAPLNPGSRPASPNGNMNLQYSQTAGSGFGGMPNFASGVATRPAQGGFQGFPGGARPLSPNLPNSISSSGVGVAGTGAGSTTMFSERGINSMTNQSSLPYGGSGQVAPLPPRPTVASGEMSSTPSGVQPRSPVSQNGFSSGFHLGGDAFSAGSSQSKNYSSVVPSSSASVQVSPPSVGGTSQNTQLLSKHGQHNFAPNVRPPGPSAVPPQHSAGQQPQLQWPRATQSDVQKYTRVFMEVDTDKDGLITGDQARDLFLSWKLPREVLKQVWALSDQDNDSMLSLREFCIALYLMERHREGRPLPATLPSSVMLDFPAKVQPAGGYGSTAWGQSTGFQHPQSIPVTAPRPSVRPPGRPPLPIPAPPSDDRLPPKPQKAKIPVLEKHLVDQLSEEEQKSLTLKFQEASDANKKVEELEKELKESREKMEFYRVKMQELVLYKSRCDSRLNEVTERAAADKREVESLAKKYEEKYMQSGDVASKLTIEEATFRDIQEKKMEMYQAIVKMEQEGTDGSLQVRADRIQSSLEELVRSLSERCKKYGLRAKPTTLLELPFGWQPGLQEGAADWDEDWDKFEDEGFTFVKEMTLDVQNVIAPPKPKVKLSKKEKKLAAEGEASMHNLDTESKIVKPTSDDESFAENGVVSDQKEDNVVRSPGSSPSARRSHGSPRDGSMENHYEKSVNSNASPHQESQSNLGGADAYVSVDKSFDEPKSGTSDTADDADSIWGSSKVMGRERLIDDLFGHGEFSLPPIRTSSSQTDGFLPKKSIFADSVPGTPADGFLPKKSVFADSVPGTPADGFMPKKSIFADSVPGTPAGGFLPKQNIFADSVPSTPLFSSSYSQKDGEGQEERGFNFSRFDSFRSSDSGFQPQERFSRFDSIRSTRDDSQDGGSFQKRETLSRFDSMRSTDDSDFGHRFSSFDDADPFGSGPFQSSFGSETARRDSDAFGSSAFRPSLGSETPRSELDPFGSVGPFRSLMANETPRADSDPFGSVGPFGSSFSSETPRGEADIFGSVGPFRSSFGSETPRADAGNETPRRETNYFAHSSSFQSSFGNETPRGDFDSLGFGGPFSSSFGSETPRRDSDALGSAGPFRSPMGNDTPKGETHSWSAF